MNLRQLFKRPRHVLLRPAPLAQGADGSGIERDDVWVVERDPSPGARRLRLTCLATGHTKAVETAAVDHFIEESRANNVTGLLRLRRQVYLRGNEMLLEPLDRKTRELMRQVRAELLENAHLLAMQPNPFSGAFPYRLGMVQRALAERPLHWPEDEGLWHSLEGVANHLDKMAEQWQFYKDYQLGRLDDALAAKITQELVYLQAESEVIVALFNHQMALLALERKLDLKHRTLVLDLTWADLVERHGTLLPEQLNRPMVLPLHKIILQVAWDQLASIARGLKAGTIRHADDVPEMPDFAVQLPREKRPTEGWALDDDQGWVSL